jgi:ATP-dependent protease ClpP protease subunit
MDVIDTMGVRVTGVAMGLIGGPAVGVLAACAHRVAMPHARFHLCEPDASFTGDARTIERWLEHRRRQWSQYCERVAASLSMPPDEVESVLAGGPYIGAEEALALRLVNEIARAKGQISTLRPGYRAGG